MPLSLATRRLLKLLEARRGSWVSAVEFAALGIRNHRQRIYELRRAGYRIEMQREYVGERRDTCYRLLEGGPNASRPGNTGDAGSGTGLERAA